jgi:predicted kinase
VDNTNPSLEDRQRYIEPAKIHKFQVIGYYFESKILSSIDRNQHRPEAQRVPEKGIRGTHARLVIPKYDEGFDELYYVRLLPDGGFDIAEWTNEV